MIVRNESALIEGAIASVRMVADEIIVVDTGSTDDTAARAAAAGATVVPWAWQDDFAAARNVSLDHCTGDWILVLDADERLTEASVTALLARLASPTAAPTACRVLIRNQTGEAPHQGFQHLMTRLMTRHPHLRFVGRIHEHLDGTGDAAVPIARETLPAIVIDHLGYLPDIVQTRGKSARNRALLDRCIAADPEDATAHHHLGMVHWSDGRNDEALAAFGRAIQLSAIRPMDPAHLIVSLLHYAACLYRLGRHREALAAARASESRCAGEPAFWFQLGLIQQALVNHPEAITAFRRVLEMPDGQGVLADFGVRAWESWIAISQSQAALGDHPAGLESQWRALRMEIPQPDLHGHLWAHALLQGDTDLAGEARRLWEARTDPAYRARVVDTVVAQLLAHGDVAGAETALRLAIAEDAGDPQTWNKLGLLALSRQQIAEAQGHFLQAVRLQPAHLSANLNLVRTAWWFNEPGMAGDRLNQAVASLIAMLDGPPAGHAAGAVRDFIDLHTYFQRWDQANPGVRSDGVAAFLAAFAVAWQQITPERLAPYSETIPPPTQGLGA